ncbi:cytochrome P450 9e2 isoform X2 [Culex quinquefasciatus]|uniref:cytochrome P450 9e2 isoform X2 n=1 Tax=Culex quinquefasciatus TaxID=7176 RepID=UPI0018E32BC3|nr:cytochrome P450 9e2 isoform X2 [Culex quinquefasciatus]
MIGLFCVGAIFLLLYYILFLNHNYFGKRGVPHHKAVPILGNAAPYVLQKRHISEVLQELCDAFPKHGFFGYFDFWCPVYMVKDVELVKKICIKDFNHFVNHRTQFSAEHDPLFANSLFSMNDSRWRNMRSVLSPAFTGSKMRSMLELMINYCEQGVESIARMVHENAMDLEMKDLFTKFSNDIIASCAFGIEVNSLENHKNQFYTNACALTRMNGIQGLKFLGYISIPKAMKFLKIAIINTKMTNFYRDLIKRVMKLRETSKILRPDMINLLMEAKNHKIVATDDSEVNDFSGITNGDSQKYQQNDCLER